MIQADLALRFAGKFDDCLFAYLFNCLPDLLADFLLDESDLHWLLDC